MPEAVEMLREDHQKVKGLFEEFEKAEEDDEKLRIVRTAIHELKIHATLEEEIFYPAVRELIEEDDQMDEALEEHHVAKLIIAELQDMEPGDERFDAKFKVLAESVKHHIEEEESEILPKAEKMELDQEQLGEEMEERKTELQAQGGGKRKSTARATQSRGQGKSKAGAKKSTSRSKYQKSA